MIDEVVMLNLIVIVTEIARMVVVVVVGLTLMV